MMGRSETNSTVGAMHFGSALMSFALGKAVQDGAQRAAVLREVDRAHAVGQAYYAKRVRQRRREALDQAAAAKVRLLANRKMIHG